MSKKDDMVQINVLLDPDVKKKFDIYCTLHNSNITKEIRGDIEKKILTVIIPEQS